MTVEGFREVLIFPVIGIIGTVIAELIKQTEKKESEPKTAVAGRRRASG